MGYSYGRRLTRLCGELVVQSPEKREDEMKGAVIEFVYSVAVRNGQAHGVSHTETVEIGPVSYDALQDAEIAFLTKFPTLHPGGKLLSWEAWSGERKTRLATYRAYIPV
jgi:hypothetical protein